MANGYGSDYGSVSTYATAGTCTSAVLDAETLERSMRALRAQQDCYRMSRPLSPNMKFVRPLPSSYLGIDMASDTCSSTWQTMDVCLGDWVTMGSKVLGRISKFPEGSSDIEIVDMDNGERIDFPSKLLWKCEIHKNYPKENKQMADRKLQVGDKVKRINGDNDGLAEGETGVLIAVNGSTYTVRADKNGKQYQGDIDNLELINEGQNTMSSVSEKFALLLMSEPEKSFFKAGLTNKDGSFTTEGKAVFEQWILKKFKDDFNKEVVQPILEEEKESKK